MKELLEIFDAHDYGDLLKKMIPYILASALVLPIFWFVISVLLSFGVWNGRDKIFKWCFIL